MSFGNSGGGTLTLPSPTHHNHIDVQSAVRTLRRSISRSPSKFNLSRSASQGSDLSATSSASQQSPTPASPSLRRMASQQFFSSPNNAQAPTTNSILAQSHTPLATPFRPNTKLFLRSGKSSSKIVSPSGFGSASKSVSRRASPKSPSKRVLNAAPSTAGNSTPSSSLEVDTSGQENLGLFRTRSPAPRRSFEKSKNRHSMHLDVSGASQAMTRFSEGQLTPTATASPLKRSDATVDLDQTTFGSPKAKRRSYGPSSFGSDFNVFEQGPKSPNFDIHDESTREYDWSGGSVGDNYSTESRTSPAAPVVVPRRAGSLRRSTLQQRERTSWGKRQAAMKLAELQNNGTSTPVKGRPRLSLDHYMPPPQRDSPFGTPTPLLNPSVHNVIQQQPQTQQAHPLSRTMTASSSNSSIPDESPTHFPQISEKPRAPMNWSKSLPIGAVRPTADDEFDNVGSVSTPDYKDAKPFFGAFASTGLVSKMTRNPELEPTGRGGAAVPDTPCKKQYNGFATYPQPVPGSAMKGRGKHIRHTFGAPSTPFNPMGSQSEGQNTFGQPASRPGLFSGFGSRHTRKGSLLSLYSDDGRASPVDTSGDSFMTTDLDLPPTPTKHQLLDEEAQSTTPNDSPTANRHATVPTSAFGIGKWQHQDTFATCEYTPSKGSCNSIVGVHEVSADEASESPPSAVPATSAPISYSLPSFSRTRAKRGSLSTPSPLDTKTMSIPNKTIKRVEFAKISPVVSASPLERIEFGEKSSPKTPLEAVAPPDASRLSISNPNDRLLFPSVGGKKSLFPPATPTTRQEAFPLFAERRAITLRMGWARKRQMLPLLDRFGKVEYIGKGEFSQVYKVVKSARPEGLDQTGSFSTPTHTPKSHSLNDVFAVKKLRLPFKGTSDRALRMREVSALEALRGAEHIVQLIASWEEKNNLYIQTEYCEEGSLDLFLAKVGLKGRLDDFRIWKVMLELCQGLQHIHNAGFVHLDLKPANILINFEGTLKIGDFGMAAALPIEEGPDFEGDREYLALEVLRGEIEKPADVFSLGLIMLEIAANVKLPDNGATWTALRKDDFSEVPVLTQDANSVVRDATGMPIDETDRSVSSSDESNSMKPIRRSYTFRNAGKYSGNLFGAAKKSELLDPPDFMQDADNSNSLDNVVKWLLTSDPAARPSVSQLLELRSLHWVAARQRAGATVYEGNWGPSDESLEPRMPLTLETSPDTPDTEMTDV
ncbi:protein kinase protein [Apiospora phragmitis]|uniref:Protein kinase protein n=1 Tax=Apiospora phragmitis TaxID=2905665 RepID=A0ABR1VQV2_9PEZI